MSKPFSRLKVISDPTHETGDIKSLKIHQADPMAVQDYQMGKIKVPGDGDYKALKKKAGPLAATDPDKKSRTAKDSRFKLNPVLKGRLAVEKEEKRVIDTMVKERIDTLAAEAKQKAYEEGFSEGLKKGHAESFSEFQKKGEGLLEEFTNFVKTCEGAKEDIYKQNERFILTMVLRICRMVLLKELETDKEYISRTAVKLLEKVSLKDNITVKINDSDAEIAKMLKESIVKEFGELKNLKIEPSEKVEKYQCVVESEWNDIDSTLDGQIEAIYKSVVD